MRAVAGAVLVVFLDASLRLIGPAALGVPALFPDLSMLAALYVGFRARDERELGLALVLGAAADCFSARPFGHFAFLYGAGAYLALRVRRYVPPDALVTHMVASFVCGLAMAFLALLLAIVTVRSYLGAGFVRALVTAATSAVYAPFVFGLFDRSRLFRKALGGRPYAFAS